MDITGKVVHKKTSVLSENTPEAAVLAAIDGIKDILRKYSIKEERLLGVGFSVPGMVDAVPTGLYLHRILGGRMWTSAEY